MSATALAGDQAKVSVLVEVPPEVAFEIFTNDIDCWWRRGLAYRISGSGGFLHLEPGLGGRLYESFETGARTKIFETGRVTAWDPPRRLTFEWRLVNFAPDEATEVEVTFAPSPSGTLVTVIHRGWSMLRGDHPARHGLEAPAFLRELGRWWGDLMTSLRERAAPPPDPPEP
jgi:uncharacterized protein YndB with AHSA1/START domain